MSAGSPLGTLDHPAKQETGKLVYPSLPVILGGYVAGATRLELATSGVTGRRSNQTELRPR